MRGPQNPPPASEQLTLWNWGLIIKGASGVLGRRTPRMTPGCALPAPVAPLSTARGPSSGGHFQHCSCRRKSRKQNTPLGSSKQGSSQAPGGQRSRTCMVGGRGGGGMRGTSHVPVFCPLSCGAQLPSRTQRLRQGWSGPLVPGEAVQYSAPGPQATLCPPGTPGSR